jgi:plasmid replication initiation protein
LDVTQPLIPLRHPNRDFFVLDITDASPRSDMAGMEFPFFSLGTQPDIREREYRRGDVILRVTPSVRGMATVFDRDVLLYCISQLMARKNAGLPIGKVVQFTAHDMLVATNRQIDGDGYKRLEQALTRLRGTTFQTTIKTGGEAATRIFGMIESADVLRKEPITGRMVAVEVVLSDFLFRAIESNQVLPIHRDYFRLRSPVDRRLYELARKHCGQQPQWQISMDLLKDKVAFSSNVRLLRAHMRRLVASQHLPDYTVDIAEDVVIFRQRAEAAAKLAAPRDGNEMTVDSLDHMIEPNAMELARTEARARNRDFYQLKAEFIEVMQRQGKPDKISGALVGFVRSKSAL